MKSAAIKVLALVGVIATGSLAALQVRDSIGDLTTRAEAAVEPSSLVQQAEPAQAKPSVSDVPTQALADFAAEPTQAYPVGASVPAVRGQGGDEPAPLDQFVAQADGINPFASDRDSQVDPFGAAPQPLPPQTDAAPIGRASLDSLEADAADPFGEAALPEVRPAGTPSGVVPAVGYDVTPRGRLRESGIRQVAGEELVPLPEDPQANVGFDFELESPAPRQAAPRQDVPTLDFGEQLPEDNSTPPVDNFDMRLDAAPMQQAPSDFSQFGPEPELPESSFDQTAAAPSAFSDQPGTQNIAIPTQPTEDEFFGDATIDRSVPRGGISPHLDIRKSAPDRAVIGEPLVYEIRLTNTGSSPATNVVVEDRIPRGSKLMGTNPVAEMPESSKSLIWRFESIAPGQTELMKIRVEPTQAGSIGSISTVRFMAETAAETRVAAPVLEFQLVGPAEAQTGEQVNYQFEIRNTGDEDARDVVVRTLVPEGLSHPGGVDLEYPVGTVPAGASKTVDLPVQAVAESGDFRTQATLEFRGGQPIDSISPIRIIKQRIKIGRVGPRKRFVSSDVKFVNRIENLSIKDLSQVSVTETLPPGVSFKSASDGGRLTRDGRKVEWLLSELPAGEARDLSIAFIAEQPGVAESTVIARAADGSQSGVRAEMDIVGFAALKVEAEHPARPFARGEQVSMRLIIRNGGTAAANDVGTTVQIPDNLKLVSVNSPVKYSQTTPNLVTFDTVGAVGMGETIEVDLVFDAMAEGDARVRVQLRSAALSTPMVHDESIRVF